MKSNLVSGRQLRAARVLAGLTQAELAIEAGFARRAAKYWESRGDSLPTCVPQSLERIEGVLARHGVAVFSEPSPGVRLAQMSARENQHVQQ
jgi:transcriptional regulator with XRE-family HTH domain